jgi:hypothetical protein
MADGSLVEVATIGNEGMTGLPVFLGARQIPGMAFNQIAGRSIRMAADVFLLTHDRVDADQFVLTQEFLSQMLGVRRGSVNLVMGQLQQAGFITYSRGVIRILDRPALESASCECYRIICDEYARLLRPD